MTKQFREKTVILVKAIFTDDKGEIAGTGSAQLTVFKLGCAIQVYSERLRAELKCELQLLKISGGTLLSLWWDPVYCPLFETF